MMYVAALCHAMQQNTTQCFAVPRLQQRQGKARLRLRRIRSPMVLGKAVGVGWLTAQLSYRAAASVPSAGATQFGGGCFEHPQPGGFASQAFGSWRSAVCDPPGGPHVGWPDGSVGSISSNILTAVSAVRILTSWLGRTSESCREGVGHCRFLYPLPGNLERRVVRWRECCLLHGRLAYGPLPPL